MTLTVTDLFCGAGGSTTGLTQVPGYAVIVASNHWQLALDTHGANHPSIDHKRADIHAVDPRTFPSTDVLWASPECTNHSKARGRKKFADRQPDLFDEILPDEAADRSRATMWDVVRFSEVHRYLAVFVENVVDVIDWACFQAWLAAMHSLGYEHHCVFANSMHAGAGGLPAPQSRDRVYIVFWRRGNRRPDFEKWTRPQAFCSACETWVSAVQGWKNPRKHSGVYRAQYLWRCPSASCRNTVVEPGWLPAAAVIDWTLEGQRIGDRKRPLAEKTMARIEAGIRKFYHQQPFVYRHYTPRSNPAQMATSVHDQLPTLTASSTPGLLVPAGGTRRDKATSLVTPMPTRTTTENDGVLTTQPFLTLLRSGRARNTAVTDPLATIVADGSNHALLVPVEGRDGKHARPASEPMRTQTARNETALLLPNHSADDAASHGFSVIGRDGLMIPLRNNNTAKHISEPLDTVTAAGNHHGLATPTPAPTDVMDWLFRMLEPHEIAAGMAFPTTYAILGNKREQVRQAGNAVCPPNARDLGYAVAESLGVLN
ncbi:DNA cytosine methyltransferase [Nocardia brasiliensis]|uniref:DNA cytosine methyltransferase n=1 Tax=Nocardia brasiliensis TaxID=37326 RepID=UPI0024544BB8|nr:DNA cytosine methyltransferase [Nocardia brasiliensis]